MAYDNVVFLYAFQNKGQRANVPPGTRCADIALFWPKKGLMSEKKLMSSLRICTVGEITSRDRFYYTFLYTFVLSINFCFPIVY